jgi:hypothetical protein
VLGKGLKIEWLYEIPAAPQDPQTTSAIPLLPTDIGRTMLVLAQLGDVFGVQTQAKQLATQDARYAPFAERLAQLARNFETEEIVALIEHYVPPPTIGAV